MEEDHTDVTPEDVESCLNALAENNLPLFKSLIPSKVPIDISITNQNISKKLKYKTPFIPIIVVAIFHDAHLCVQYMLDIGHNPRIVDNNNNTYLIIAAIFNNFNVFRVLIQTGEIDFNAQNIDGDTALHKAAFYGNNDIVRLLLELGDLKINIPNQDGDIPLFMTLYQNSLDTFDLLVNISNMEHVNKQGENIVNFAVRLNKPQFLKEMINKPQYDVNYPNFKNQAPLYLASKTNKFQCVGYLLMDSRTKINIDISKHCRTPLHVAAKHNFFQSMQLLFTMNDLDVNKGDSFAKTPLHLAAEFKAENAANLLLTHPDINPNLFDSSGMNPFAYALVNRDFNMITLFISDPQVNFDDKKLKDSDLLSNFVSNGNYDAVEGLIQRGFHPDLVDSGGKTPLIIAVSNGNVDLVRLLLSTRKININKRFNNDYTVLHFACVSKLSSKCLRLLLLYPGIDINAPDSKMNTPLHFAVGSSINNAVDILLSDKNVMKNQVNYEGLTPFHLAVLTGDMSIIKLFLFNKYVDRSMTTPKGNTALTLALAERKYDIALALIEDPEIDINAVLQGRGTFLAMAVQDEKVDIVKHLLNFKMVKITNIGPNGVSFCLTGESYRPGNEINIIANMPFSSCIVFKCDKQRKIIIIFSLLSFI